MPLVKFSAGESPRRFKTHSSKSIIFHVSGVERGQIVMFSIPPKPDGHYFHNEDIPDLEQVIHLLSSLPHYIISTGPFL